MRFLRYFQNPHSLTKSIFGWTVGLVKLATVDLARYNIKKLAQKTMGIRPQAIDQLPRRYLFFIYGCSMLATLNMWGMFLAILYVNPFMFFKFLLLSSIFYGLPLFVIRSYPNGAFSVVSNLANRVTNFVSRLIEAIRETR